MFSVVNVSYTRPIKKTFYLVPSNRNLQKPRSEFDLRSSDNKWLNNSIYSISILLYVFLQFLDKRFLKSYTTYENVQNGLACGRNSVQYHAKCRVSVCFCATQFILQWLLSKGRGGAIKTSIKKLSRVAGKLVKGWKTENIIFTSQTFPQNTSTQVLSS